MMHIGKQIRTCLKEQGKTVTWFAKELKCTRMNVYKIFKRESVETSLLKDVSMILEYNFFKDLSEQFLKELKSAKELDK